MPVGAVAVVEEVVVVKEVAVAEEVAVAKEADGDAEAAEAEAEEETMMTTISVLHFTHLLTLRSLHLHSHQSVWEPPDSVDDA